MRQQELHALWIGGEITHHPFSSSADWERLSGDPMLVGLHTHRVGHCDAEKAPAVDPNSVPIVLVDGMNLAFRSHFAFAGLKALDGELTGMRYGFLKAIRSLRKEISPRIVVLWDNGEPDGRPKSTVYWRKALFPAYKQGRQVTTDTTVVFQQLPSLLHILRCLGYPSLGVAGLEADDLFGILVAYHPTERFCLYTSDRDVYQLLRPGVQVLRPGKEQGAYRRIGGKQVAEEFGVHVRDWAKYLALGGDASDNIKPVPGFGPQKARQCVALGAEPRLAFAENPAEFRKSQLGQLLSPHWAAVQLAYQLACLPRRFWERRIAGYTKDIRLCPLTAYRGPHIPRQQRQARMATFMQFCGDCDFRTFLAAREEFLPCA